MTDKVVDACVILSIVFPSQFRQEAGTALAGATLFAPKLIRYELANVYLNKVRAVRPKTRERILSAFKKCKRFDIHEVEIDYDEVFSLADIARLSFYDASYLWLARKMNVPLITFDKKLKKAALKFMPWA